MNSKEFKAEKKVRKNKSNLKNGGQQIFVLPPNLLQKLGINLGNVGSTPISPEVAQKMSSSIPLSKHGHSSSIREHEANSNVINDETSITKTASLMKESVFLSPTFNSENLNNVGSSHIEGYIEVCNAEIDYASEGTKIILDQNCDLSDVFSQRKSINNIKQEVKHDASAHEGGLSIKSHTLQTNGSTYENSLVKSDTKKVINIISEETVTVDKLNELKVLQIPPKNALIPASLNTVIGKNVKKLSIVQSQTTFSECITENIDMPHNKSNGKLPVDKIKIPIIENDVNANSELNNVENGCKFDNKESQMLNIKGNKQVSEHNDNDKYIHATNCKKTGLSKHFSYDNSHNSVVERQLHYSPCQKIFGENNETKVEESMLTDQDFNEDITSTLSNKHNQNQHIKNQLLDNHLTLIAANVDDNKLELMKVDGIARNIQCYSSEIVNINNNNTWDNNKSNVEQEAQSLMVKSATYVSNAQENNMETTCSRNKKDNFSYIEDTSGFTAPSIEDNSLEDDPRKYTPIMFETRENSYFVKQDVPFEVNKNDMTSLSNSLKSVKKCFSNSNDNDGDSQLSLPLNPKRNNFISKLCIQGVEKPGGIKTDISKPVSLKTYSNIKKHNTYEKCLFSVESIFDKKLDNNSNIDLNYSSTNTLFTSQPFCKCCDYGLLDGNQLESSYEHIHFTRRRPLDCSPDIIFSIYDDEIVNISESREKLDHIEDNPDCTDSEYSGQSICWHNADLLQNQSDIECKNSQKQGTLFPKSSQVEEQIMEGNNSIDTYNNSNEFNSGCQNQPFVAHDPKHQLENKLRLNPILDTMNVDAGVGDDSDKNINKYDFQKILRKRKRSYNCDEALDMNNVEVSKKRAAENEVKNTETEEKVSVHGFKGWKTSDDIVKEEFLNVSSKQQQVKCAVCGISVINADWSTHVAAIHDYIAWKEGESPVDLGDEDAIRDHLHHVVQELGHLECSNCGLSRKYAKSFLQHIKICNSSSDIKDDTQIRYHLSKIIEVETFRRCDHCDFKCKNAKDYETHAKRCIRKSELCSRNSNGNTEVEVSRNVTCGVCKEEMTSQQWIPHIQREHSYRAWREDETPLNLQDEDLIRKHLYRILQEHGPLVCVKCGKSRKYVKLFLQHVEGCTGPKEDDNTLDTTYVELESVLDTSLDDTGVESTKVVKCGRCKQEMESKEWIDHIQEKHDYLSWQEGKTPLDISDEEAVQRYLYVVVQKLGSLACAKCGVARKYVKNYLSHIKKCTGPSDSDANSTNKVSVTARLSTSTEVEISVETNISSQRPNTTSPRPTVDSQVDKVQPVTTVKCGVCQKEMVDSKWITHIGMNHEYIAWKALDTPVDLSSYEQISQHLTNIIRKIGALKCADCGRKCKYANVYLMHIKACYGKTYVEIDGGNGTMNDSVSDMDTTLDTSCVDEEDNDRPVRCGVCSEEVEARRWIDHIYKQHNYLAWRDGETALNLENEESIRNHLKSVLRKVGRLKCVKCGLHRKKVIPFYNHIKTCDGTVESLERPLRTLKPKVESTRTVKCAVCQSEMSSSLWIEHIAKEHDYMAWICGEEPLKEDDETSIKEHLYKISQNVGELICSKCGQSRKYVKSYLQHARGCSGPAESPDGTFKVPKTIQESTEIITCALCQSEMNNTMWMEHISKEHNYVAWKQNDRPLVLESEKALRDYLYSIVQAVGSLACSKCGLVRKYAKSYLQHIETCQRVTWVTINKMIMKMKKEKGDMVRCAVCGVVVDDTEWVEHISVQHNYLAWRDRDPPVNLQDEDEVLRHLKNIIQSEGYLKCPKCNIHRKYAKLYLHHVNTCDGIGEESVEINDSLNNSEIPSDDIEVYDSDGSAVKCGVCAQQVGKGAWIAHIQKEHKYLAWPEGKEPLDLNDKEAVYNHLSAINVKCKGLTCNGCGVVRKYVKAYLHHVRDCSEGNYVDSNETVECGVCGEKLIGKFWRDHAMQVHYNVAWVAGDTPIDVRNFFSVDKYLKEYHEQKHKLVCNICGLSRASLAGFYAHVLVCGKTEEEIDTWKDVCTICSQKYLCIYKTQHYWTHRVQEMAKERKIQGTLKKEEHANEDVNFTPGRRRAAEKARSVIGDYAAKFACFKCKSCTFETDSKEDLASHRCGKRAMKANEDSDDSVSIKLEDYSEDESEYTDADSELSTEEEGSNVAKGVKKRNKKDGTGGKLSSKSSKFPFEVRDVKPYLQRSKFDHFELFYTRETLFTHWRSCTFEVVSHELMSQYTPQLEESCKISISNGSWTTCKRFESKIENGCVVLFTGGSIQCIAWAPEHPDSTRASYSLLAVATHRGPDCPRLISTDTPSHPALIQIWDFQNFKSVPKLAFGLAHDYGTVWAMDWCPSGARDTSEQTSDDNTTSRLGLLALACSNGSAYILSVPYPDKNSSGDTTFYKIRPCVELRLTRGNNKYQATSINWSLFKGYTTVSVGYGDGTVALYDLVTESPLLTAREGDIDILYPFQDERVHNSCVTGLTSCVLGAWCSSSVTGSTAGVAGTEPRVGRGARPLRAHSSLAASAATFMPHWPNVMLSGDDTIVGLSPSELEWGYVGRRVGSVRALAPCVHRARVVAVVPPLLQVMRPHPAAFKGHKTIHKKNVAMLEMTPLAKKRSKHSNDELSMKVEPTTYEDAIASYGIEFKFEKDFDKMLMQRMQQKQRVPFPERFPLGDVPALAYCPAVAHHTKLALATHSGLLLLLDV